MLRRFLLCCIATVCLTVRFSDSAYAFDLNRLIFWGETGDKSINYNLRYSSIQAFSIGLTGQGLVERLQINVSPGLKAGKLGVGVGFAGGPEGAYNGLAMAGLGAKASALKMWSNGDNRTYAGVELSVAYLVGIDLGLYSEISGGSDKRFNFAIGLGY